MTRKFKVFLVSIMLSISLLIVGCEASGYSDLSLEVRLDDNQYLGKNVLMNTEQLFINKVKIPLGNTIDSYNGLDVNSIDSFFVERKLHEDVDECFKYTFTFYDLKVGNDVIEVLVEDQSGNQVDEIIIPNVSMYFPEQYYVTDINFDGYKDLLLLAGRFDSKANHEYYGLLWNENEGKYSFISVPAPNLSIDRNEERLLTVQTNWAASHTYKIWKYEKGEFVLEKQLLIEVITPNNYDEFGVKVREDVDYWLFEEYSNQEGNLLMEKQNITYSGDDYYDEVVERYFSVNSSWQLQTLRFYQSDYGKGLGFHDQDGNEINLSIDLGYDDN